MTKNWKFILTIRIHFVEFKNQPNFEPTMFECFDQTSGKRGPASSFLAFSNFFVDFVIFWTKLGTTLSELPPPTPQRIDQL